MGPTRMFRLLAGAALCFGGVAHAESMFETFGGMYNSMLFGNYLASNGDTEGRQYVSGQFFLLTEGDTIGYAVVGKPNGPQAGRDDLVVGGSFLGGSISSVTENAVLGGVVVDGTIGFSDANSQSSGTGTLREGAGDFRLDLTTGNVTNSLTNSIGQAELLAALQAESLALGQLDTSAGVAVVGDASNLSITISGGPGLKVVNLTSAQWSTTLEAVRSITVDPSAAGSTIVINVDGTTITLDGGSMELVGVEQEYVLFNYYEAETWHLTNFLHEGSVLAPFTTQVVVEGSINGSVVLAGSISKSGHAVFQNFLFQGDLSAVPEPGASFTILAGLSVLIGRRRRR